MRAVAALGGSDEDDVGHPAHALQPGLDIADAADRVILRVEQHQRRAHAREDMHGVAGLVIGRVAVMPGQLVKLAMKRRQIFGHRQSRGRGQMRDAFKVGRDELAHQLLRHHSAVKRPHVVETDIGVIAGAIGERGAERRSLTLLAKIAHE